MECGIQLFRKILFLILFLRADFIMAGEAYFVSPIGNDSNPGTMSAPWAKLITGIRNSQPGDTLYLRGGFYNEDEIYISETSWGGRPSSPKIIRAFPGEKPILGGSRRLINRVNYVKFIELNFQLPFSLDSNGEQVEIIKCTFNGQQPWYGAIEFEGNNGLIQDNVIKIDNSTGRTQDHGIYVHSGTGTIVKGNSIYGPSGYGIHIYDEKKSWDSTHFERVIKNILIEDNFIAGSRSRSGIIVSHGNGVKVLFIIIRNNIITANNHHGILVNRGRGIFIYNNTFYNNGRQGIGLINNYEDLNQLTIINNIIVQEANNNCSVDCQWYPLAHIEITGSIEDMQCHHNLYWPGPLKISGVNDPQRKIADPLFLSAEQNQFSLQPASPAINAGFDIGLPFNGKAPDIGAIEMADHE